ncbi:MAG: Spy/CpxP family protein refolding chaperone [Magnetovibrio sp.]|nr:Spy/CpxP family protein refolding chaperone [Magnetovibrio sp.]
MKTATKTIAAVTAIVAGAFIIQSAVAGPGYRGFGGPGMMGPGMMMGQGGPGHYGMMNHMMGSPMSTTTSFDAKWAETTKADLGITPDQTQVWDAYVDAVKEDIETHQALRDSMDPQAMHELSWDDHRGVMQSHWETRQELADAVNKARTDLIAQLNPQQKSKAQYLLGQQGRGGFGPMAHGFRR